MPYLILISTWANTLASSHQELSPASLSDLFKTLGTTTAGFSPSLLPSIRLVLADEVRESVNLHREAVCSLSEPLRRQALAISALAGASLLQKPLQIGRIPTLSSVSVVSTTTAFNVLISLLIGA